MAERLKSGVCVIVHQAHASAAEFVLTLTKPLKSFMQKILNVFPRHMKSTILTALIACASTLALAEPMTGKVTNPGIGDACVKTGHPVFTKACVTHTLHYRFDSLMGEPVKNYALEWRLNTIQATRPCQVGACDTAERRSSGLLSPNDQDWPPQIQEAFKKLTLLSEGQVIVQQAKYNANPLFLGLIGVGIAYDTGVSTPAGKLSWNVPGSPQWGQLFQIGEHQFASADEAKTVWMQRLFGVANVHIQRLTFGNWEAVDRALGDYCEHAPRNAGGYEPKGLCEAKKPEKKGEKESKPRPPQDDILDAVERPTAPRRGRSDSLDVLDQAADGEIIRKATAVARKQFREEAAAQCRKSFQEVEHCRAVQQCPTEAQRLQQTNQCIGKLCGPKPNPRLFESYNCRQDCGPPRALKPGESRMCFPTHNCDYRDVGPNPAYESWQSCSARSSNECTPPNQCEQQCNPKSLSTESACIDAAMARAPSEADVRARTQKAATAPRAPGNAKVRDILD